MKTAADCAQAAAALAASGRDAEAAARYESGLAQFPGDARFANSAGNFHARARRDVRAVELFELALRLEPALDEAAINAAIVLLRLGRARSAAGLLARYEVPLAGKAQYWALRSDAARALGHYEAADRFIVRALASEPASRTAQQTRARLSLERGKARAVDEYEAALSGEPGNFELMHGYILALQAASRLDEALEFGAALAAHFPSWTAGQAVLAELRWAAGDPDYAGHFAAAAAAHPTPETHLAWASLLAGNDAHAAAADVLTSALMAWPDNAQIRLECAVALGEAGEAGRADDLLARTAITPSPEWEVARARNDLRLNRIDAASARLDTILSADPGNIAAWALLDLCWRLTGDSRHDWLHGQSGLVRELDLPLDQAQLDAVRATLRGLHAASAVPLAQSVKGGTQTRGALFARVERELALLNEALNEVFAAYRRGLPPMDATHPLLAQRDASWMIAGSWSVRFEGSGRHAAHIHPRGLLSSACYIVVPPEVDEPGGPGWLELGRPPPGLAPELGPLQAIRPRPGMCALFPSTLFHGTRPIGAGERMTVAFDVMPEPG